MADSNSGNSSSSVASVAIVVLVIVAIFALYFIFGRTVSANRSIDVDIKTPNIDKPFDKR
jgi:hypothetical protein